MEGSADAAPKSVGRYSLIEPIGRGASATVWRAHDPALDRDVAVKLVQRWRGLGGSRDEATARVIREAQAVAALNHPNIVPIFDVGRFATKDGDGVFLAMEYLGGHSLRSWLRDEDPDRQEILDAFDQAARGLSAAHSTGVVHRDFKPSNVMIDAQGRVRVIDFGLARAVGDAPSLSSADIDNAVVVSDLQASLTTTGTVMGTPAYMSPEQHKGLAVGPESDQFSFCVALFEALVGQRPYPGDTIRDLAVSKLEERIDGLDLLPGDVRMVLRRGLSADPAQRWPDMDALAHALRPPTGRGRVGVLVLAAAVVTGAAAMLWGPSRRDAPASTPTVVEAIETPPQVADIRLLRETGHHDHALQLGRTALEATLEDPAAHATVVAEHARTAAWSGAPTDAARIREAAFHEATTADAHAVAFELAVELTVHAFERTPSDARRWLGHASAALERMDAGPVQRATLLGLRAQEAENAYDLAAAERQIREALALLDGHDALDVEERLLIQQAQVVARLGRFDGHLDALALAADRVGHELGPSHPRYGQALARIAAPAMYLDERELSRHASKRSVEVIEGAVPFGHFALGRAWGDRALALAELEQPELGLDAFVTAESVLERADSPMDRDLELSILWGNRGLALAARGRDEEALRFMRRAKDTQTRLLGAAHLHVTSTGNNIAMLLRRTGRLEEAEREAKAVAATFEGSPGDPSMRAFTYLELAGMMLESDRHEEALAWAQRAIEVWDAVGKARSESASACFLAARAALPNDRDAAERHARDALARVSDPSGAPVIEAWLAEHGFD